MTLDEIKSFLLQLEAEKKNSDETRGARANLSQRKPVGYGVPEWQSGPHSKCFRCNKRGHVVPK